MLRLPLAIALLATATLAQSEIRLAVAWGSGIPPQQHLPVTIPGVNEVRVGLDLLGELGVLLVGVFKNHPRFRRLRGLLGECRGNKCEE